MNLLALPGLDHEAAHDSAHDAATPGLLRQAIERIAEQAERADRVIKTVHDFVRRDRTMLDQVLLNLACNDLYAMQTTHGDTATRRRARVRARTAGRGHGVPRRPGGAPPSRKRRNSGFNTGRFDPDRLIA